MDSTCIEGSSMSPTEDVKSFLHLSSPETLRVELHYVDLTNGETTENYFVVGQKSDFSSIYEFAAHALLSVCQHMAGNTIESFETSWAGLEVVVCEPEPWMKEYKGLILPGEWLCFPKVETLGFTPPIGLERKLFVVPGFSATEECLACEGIDVYAFLYWHTTG